MEHKTEVPIPGQRGHAFGTLSVLRGMPEGEDYCRKVMAFLRFGNVLTVFYGRHPLADLLAQHGQAVRAYGADLLGRCQSDAALASRLAQQDTDVRGLFATQPNVSFAVDLFADLVRSQEWELLAEQARRHLENPDAPTLVQARRMLAFALAHSAYDKDRTEATRAYEALIHDGLAEAQDRANLAALLLDTGRSDDAKAVVLDAIAASSPESLERFNGIGQRIVGQTGDREFRKQLEAAIAERGDHD